MTDTETESLEQHHDIQRDTQAAGAAVQVGADIAARQQEQRLENPEFLAQLRDLGIDTAEYPWLEARLGPLQADAHLIANRSPSYEREAKWLDQNRGERVIAEAEPGRLCRGRVLEIAQRVHNRDQKDPVDPMTMDERRVVRDAMEAITNFKTLGIEKAGLSSVAESTVVTKREKMQQESKSRREQAAEFLG
jgi:hypothetical protein